MSQYWHFGCDWGRKIKVRIWGLSRYHVLKIVTATAIVFSVNCKMYRYKNVYMPRPKGSIVCRHDRTFLKDADFIPRMDIQMDICCGYNIHGDDMWWLDNGCQSLFKVQLVIETSTKSQWRKPISSCVNNLYRISQIKGILGKLCDKSNLTQVYNITIPCWYGSKCPGY